MDKKLLDLLLNTKLESNDTMTWNHRIVDMSHENYGDPWFEVREVSYDAQGKPSGFVEASMGTEDPANIIALLQRMIDDIKRSPTPIKFDTQETSND